MPKSKPHGKWLISLWSSKVNPIHQRVLDIGIGEGTYSDLVGPILPDAEWTGVEAWEPYVEEYDLNLKYDTILIGDARELDLSGKQYDIAFCGDVLDLMTKEDAIALVSKLRNCSDLVVLSIPIIYNTREDEIENPYEVRVKTDWTHEEVLSCFEGIIDSKNYIHSGVYLLQGVQN